MKRLITYFLLLLVAIALVGCSDKDQQNNRLLKKRLNEQDVKISNQKM